MEDGLEINIKDKELFISYSRYNVKWDDNDNPWTKLVPLRIRFIWNRMSEESRFFVFLTAYEAAKMMEHKDGTE